MKSGEIVGDYRIIRVLGRGAMATTYEADRLSTRTRVAVKELCLSQLDDWKILELFERESRVLAYITHPAVPEYVDHFSIERPDGPAFYIVQQLAPGKSLAQRVTSGWRPDEGEAKRMAEVLLDVLDYLHARRPPVFHRDIKPQNVIVEDTGKVWLVDFGSVRDAYKATSSGSTTAGTFGYMAPEQLRGIARPESDLHGLGATLLFVLSGQSPSEMPQHKLRVDFRSRIRASPAFATWLATMLEPAPEDRFPSAHQALLALRKPQLAAAHAPRRKRTVVLAAVLGTLVATAAALGIAELRLGAKFAPAQAATSLSTLPQRPTDWLFPAVRYVRSIPAHFNAVSDAAFTPDGAKLLTASFDGTAKIWDATTGQSSGALPGHTGRVGAVRVMADGRQAVTSDSHALHVWSLPDRKLLRTIDADRNQVFSLSVSPNGKTLVSGGSDGQAKVWNLDGSLAATLAHGGTRVQSVAFSPDGSRIATAGDDRTIKVWNVAGWGLMRTLSGHTAAVSKAVIAPDGQVVASASDDHTVKLWHLETGARLASLALHTDEVWALAFSPDGGTLLSGGKDAVLGVWAIPTATLRQRVDLRSSVATLGLSFAPDGVTFASTYGNGVVDLWRMSNMSHVALAEPIIVAKDLAPTATPEERAYAQAMDIVDASEGDRGLFDAADTVLREALKASPRSALAYSGLGRIPFRRAYTGGDRYESAGVASSSELASKAIAINPALPDGYCVRGWAAWASKDAEGARSAADMALKLAPTMPRATLLFAELAVDRGDLQAAETALRSMLSRPIDRANAAMGFRKLAEVYEQLGIVDGAEQAYQRQIAVEPQSAWAKGNYANFLVRKGDYGNAIDMANRALSQMKYPAAERTLATALCLTGEQLLWDRGDADAAAHTFQAASAADPRYGRAVYDIGAYHQYVAAVRHDSSHMREARSSYEKAVALDPSDELQKKAPSTQPPAISSSASRRSAARSGRNARSTSASTSL